MLDLRHEDCWKLHMHLMAQEEVKEKLEVQCILPNGISFAEDMEHLELTYNAGRNVYTHTL